VDTSKLSKKEGSIYKNLSITTHRFSILVYGGYYKHVSVKKGPASGNTDILHY